MDEKKMKIFSDKNKKIFIVVFGVALAIRLINFYSLLPSKIDTTLFSLITVWAFAIFIIDVLSKNIKIYKTDYLLLAFILAILCSTFFNGPNGIVENIKLVIWQFIYVFVIYRIGRDSIDSKFIIKFEKLITGIWNILVIISLGMFFTHYSYVAPLDKFYNGFRAGFVENRLYGIFADPNFASVISIVVILFAIKQWLDYKAHRRIVFYSILTIFLQMNYIILSGSRTSEIGLLICVFTGGFFWFYQISSQKRVSRIIIGLLVGMCATGAVFFIHTVGEQAAPKIVNVISHHSNRGDEKKRQTVTLDRADVKENDNVSNNRFALWKSSIEIFESRPFIGSSPRNLVEYAQKNIPETFIATKKQTSHNFVFYLLATTGLLGTLPLVFFLFIKVIESVKRLFSNKEDIGHMFLMNNLIVLSVLISALFLTELVLVNKLGSLIFWLYLGYISKRYPVVDKGGK